MGLDALAPGIAGPFGSDDLRHRHDPHPAERQLVVVNARRGVQFHPRPVMGLRQRWHIQQRLREPTHPVVLRHVAAMKPTQQKIGAPGADFAVPIHVAISIVMRKLPVGSLKPKVKPVEKSGENPV